MLWSSHGLPVFRLCVFLFLISLLLFLLFGLLLHMFCLYVGRLFGGRSLLVFWTVLYLFVLPGVVPDARSAVSNFAVFCLGSVNPMIKADVR